MNWCVRGSKRQFQIIGHNHKQSARPAAVQKEGDIGKFGRRGIKRVKGRTLCKTLQKTILMINMQKVRGSGGERGQVHTGTAGSSVLNLHDCFVPIIQETVLMCKRAKIY